MAGLRSGVDSALAQDAGFVGTPQRGARTHRGDATDALRDGASWITVSDNVKRMVAAWEADGAIAGDRCATRKEAIRHAIRIALDVAAGRAARLATRM